MCYAKPLENIHLNFVVEPMLDIIVNDAKDLLETSFPAWMARTDILNTEVYKNHSRVLLCLRYTLQIYRQYQNDTRVFQTS